MANPWFRLYHEFSTDSGVQMLSEVDQRRYLMILCARCRNGDKPLHDETAAFEMRISREDWEKTKANLIKTGLIDSSSKPTGWDKRQYVSDLSTSRSTKCRAKKKLQRARNVAATAPDTDTETETDTDANTEVKKRTAISSLSSAKRTPVPYEKIVDLYHKCLPSLPAVVKITAKRKTQIRQRFSEDLNALNNWKNYFEYIAESDFLMGRTQPTNSRPVFIADLEWITHAGHFTKITEGKYHLRET